MKNRFTPFFVLASLLALALNACAANPAATTQPLPTEPAETEPAMPTQPKPTATQPAVPEPVEKTVYVGPELVDCVGVAPQKCLQVKENPGDEYTLFYGQIEGFEYEAGYEYKLVVREEKIENPPADAPDFKWTLVEVVSKSPVQATATPEALQSMEGQLYTLDWYLSAGGEQVQVLPEAEITAEVKDGMIAGSAGCNRYSAQFLVDGDQIRIEGAITTLMACPDPIMQQEQAYLETLQKAASYSISGSTLTFADAQGITILSFTAVQPLPLTGTYWELTGYNNGKGGFTSLISGTQVTAIFGKDGNLAGSAGCNSYSAAYTVDGDAISIGPAASTRMFCGEPEGVMDQESAYLAALGTASTYTIQGDNLALFDAQGSRVAEYQANPLVGETWSLAEIQYMNDTTKTPDDPARYTVEFLPDGTVNIKADCNNAGGEYTISGSSLSISITHTTRAACPPDSISGEFLENLRIAASYQFEGNDLYIATQMDVAILKFTPLP